MATGKKQELLLVDERILSDVVFLLGKYYQLQSDAPQTEKDDLKDFIRIKDIKDRLLHAMNPSPDVKFINDFSSLFYTMAGYNYIIGKLIKAKHIIEINPENYSAIRGMIGGKSGIKTELLDELLPHLPPLKWIADKRHFKATMDEIFEKGYIRRRLSEKKSMELAEEVFKIPIKLPTIKSSSLHPDLIGKIKKASVD